MRRARINWSVAVAFLFLVSLAQAEVRILRQSDGSSARITDLGNGVGIISDPHGTVIPAPLPLHLDPNPLGQHDGQAQRTVTPFGSPAPPNNLSLPPVLPFNPNRALTPSPSLPSAMPSSSAGPTGRFGR